MPNLPLSTDFTNSSVTEGLFKTAITNQREYLAGLLGTDGLNTTALATLGAIFGSLTSKNANYTVIASDRGEIIQCTATLELALTAAATLGSSFSFIVNNTGSGTVTINPSGSELIDKASTKVIAANQACIVYCDGTDFYTVGLSAKVEPKFKTQVFTTPSTWTKPDNVTEVRVTVLAGGGGGYNAVGTLVGGFGGAAIAQVPVSAPVAITVGTGGARSTPRGATGGASSFGSAVSATGGTGAGSNPSGAQGVPGTGLVSTGTALRFGHNLASIGKGAGPSARAQTWSISMNAEAGEGGASASSPTNPASATPGVGGVVIVEWVE